MDRQYLRRISADYNNELEGKNGQTSITFGVYEDGSYDISASFIIPNQDIYSIEIDKAGKVVSYKEKFGEDNNSSREYKLSGTDWDVDVYAFEEIDDGNKKPDSGMRYSTKHILDSSPYFHFLDNAIAKLKTIHYPALHESCPTPPSSLNLTRLKEIALRGYKTELERDNHATGDQRLYHLEFLISALQKPLSNGTIAQIVTAADVIRKIANSIPFEVSESTPTEKPKEDSEALMQARKDYAVALRLLQPILSELPTTHQLKNPVTRVDGR